MIGALSAHSIIIILLYFMLLYYKLLLLPPIQKAMRQDSSNIQDNKTESLRGRVRKDLRDTRKA
jgi:F0F1-type ATP synthase membrane subunit b/b'